MPLSRLFDAFRKEEIAGKPKEYALRLFDEWAYRSQLPKFSEVSDLATTMFQVEHPISDIKDKLCDKLPFDKKLIERFIDRIEAEKRRNKRLDDVIPVHVWELYTANVSSFLQQTAHVIVSRLLLYRVGLDKGVFDQMGLPDPPRPYLRFCKAIRERMETSASGIYFLSEFDWWYVPDVYRGALALQQQTQLGNIEDELDVAASHIVETLRAYDFSNVDRDVWKDVYLSYLSQDERQRLGFVPTPDEVVELILDLAGYEETNEGLCQEKLIDPACGSGTFLVEALLRLRKHLERKMNCHAELHERNMPTWERNKKILDTLTEEIHGVDIHPFATFLTTLNLLFQVLDLFSTVKDHYPDYSLGLKIVTHDSLVLHPSLAEYQQERLTNARLAEAVKRTRQYEQINNLKFGYVVGNPPWGGVLRGKIGPLGDAEKRKEYEEYKGAFGKFDIYALFIERGLRWLDENGILGMITQVTYLDSSFGKGILDYIKENATITHIVDLSDLGDIIFPGFTNYPAISIMRKTRAPSEANTIRIKVTGKKT